MELLVILFLLKLYAHINIFGYLSFWKILKFILGHSNGLKDFVGNQTLNCMEPFPSPSNFFIKIKTVFERRFDQKKI